jgi:hypothetical protein
MGFRAENKQSRKQQRQWKCRVRRQNRKNLIRKALDAGTDPYLAILDYRNTPTQGMESSPVQRLMNRRTRTLLLTTKALLKPRTTRPDQDIKDLSKRQQQQSKYYNPHTRALTPLDKGHYGG